MTYREPLESWQSRVTAIASSFRKLEAFPPLIAQYESGRLLVNDGSHRVAAFQDLGLDRCWVIVWYADDAEFEHHKRRGFNWNADVDLHQDAAGFFLDEEPGIETDTFRILKTRHGWRIDTPVLHSHILPRVALDSVPRLHPRSRARIAALINEGGG